MLDHAPARFSRRSPTQTDDGLYPAVPPSWYHYPHSLTWSRSLSQRMRCAMVLYRGRPSAVLVPVLLVFALFASSEAAGEHDPYMSGLWNAGSAIFTVDPATGAETHVAYVVQPGGEAAYVYQGGLAYDPDLDVLYATGSDAASTSLLFRIDPDTGQATIVGPTGGTTDLIAGGLAFDTQSRILYATGQQADSPPLQGTHLYAIDPATGAATDLGWTGAPGTYLHGLGYDPLSGQLYALGYKEWGAASSLFLVDKASGHATWIGHNGLEMVRALAYGGLAFHPETHVLYATGSVDGAVGGLFVVDPGNGLASLVGSFTAGVGCANGGLVFIDREPAAAPETVAVAMLPLRGFPNPFNPRTTLRYELPRAGFVRLRVADLAGRLVRTLVDDVQAAGRHEVDWDGRDDRGREVGSGAYLMRLEAGGVVEVARMTMVR